MMQVLKLYDPARKPTEWTGLVHAGQFAVFHSDVATDVERSPDGHYLQPGDHSVCIVFDSLAEAETYCEIKVDQIPNLRCDIYDHTGKSKPPQLTYVNKIHLKAGSKRQSGDGLWSPPACLFSGWNTTGATPWSYPW